MRVFFYSSERSIVQAQRKYRQNYNVRISFSDKMIRNIIARFERIESDCELQRRGPKRTVPTDAAVEAVR